MTEKQTTKAYQFPGAWQLLKESVQYLGGEWKYLLKVSLWPLVVTLVTMLVGVLISLLVGVGMGVANGVGFDWKSMVMGEGRVWLVGLGIALGVAYFVFLMVLQMWGATALIVAVADPDPERGARATFRRAWPVVGKFWWAVFLGQLAVMGGTLLLVVPGIVLIFSLMMVSWVVVVEKKGGTAALLASRYYMKGRKLSILWRLIVVNVAFFVLNLVVSDLTQSRLNSVTVLAVIATMVLSMCQGVLSLIFTYRCYLALKEEKETVEFRPSEAKGRYIFLEWLGLALLVLGVAGAGLLAAFNPAGQIKKAKDVKVQSDVEMVAVAVERYRAEKGELPGELTDLKGDYLPLWTDWEDFQYYHYDDESYSVCGELADGAFYCQPAVAESEREL